MSYDLYFCADHQRQIDRADLARYFSNRPFFKEDWSYENPDTGVYCSFSYIASESNDVETLTPDGYSDTHLAFNMNYMRPKFFAYEGMPLVEDVCRNFNLLVIDPQAHSAGGDSNPKIAKSNELIDSWVASNRIAVKVYQQQGASLPYLREDLAYNWWQYQLNLNRIQKVLGDSIFVPNIFLLADKQSSSVRTAITWTESIPFVFPPCDMVIVIHHKELKRLFRRKSEATLQGWIEAAEVRRRLQDHLTTIATEIGNLDTLRPEQTKFARSIFLGLPVSKFEGFVRIAPDGFIDER